MGKLRAFLYVDVGQRLPIFSSRMIAYCFVAPIKELLAIFEAASGQMVNKDKTTLFFSKKTDDESQEVIKQSLDVQAIQHYEKYFMRKNNKACFTLVKERICHE